MYCFNCGKKIDDGQYVCLNCGKLVHGNISNDNASVLNVDSGSIIWVLIGFFVPLAGLVLYISWKEKRPMDAKKAGYGALVSAILNAVWIIFVIILQFTLIG